MKRLFLVLALLVVALVASATEPLSGAEAIAQAGPEVLDADVPDLDANLDAATLNPPTTS